ncbi:MAG: YlmC/YmxH family sporulation protein [Oscillospiraceae bacterium]|nr:YlmC/YmxH family sporulation protein [Oscillospiraceae bacterium]
MKIGDLQYKEVINISTGQRLGYIADVEFDIHTGKVLSFIIPGPRKLLGLFPGETDYIFPWESIVRMGDDTILISTDFEDPNTKKNIHKKIEKSLY